MTDVKKNAFLEWLKKFVTLLGAWAHKYLGGLFMEEKDGKQVVSIGRVSFAVVLSVMIWVWYRCMVYEETVALPPGLMEAFYTTAGYVFGSKVVGMVKGLKNGK